MLKGIGRTAHGERVRIPVIANSQDMQALGDAFEKAHEPGVPIMLVARHGMYAWGRDLTEARHHAEIAEWLLGFQIETRER